ncbi:DNA-directed RNA polymerase subunit omega [Mycoplasmatota bacterium]|nr:DNA-directed RNA polymerase subunit omega [Mycoplasmatota bacterium]
MKEDLKYIPTQGNRFGDYNFGGFLDDEEEKPVKLKNLDGLRYPSIDNLLEVVDSKYKLAYIAAKRAKIIKKTDYSSVDNKCVKPVGKALEEILAGKVTAKFE